MATPGFSGFGGGPCWVFSHFQVSSILLRPDALVLGGPTTHQCVCLFVRFSGCLSLFLFYFSHLFFCFLNLSFLSFPSQRPSSSVTRGPCLGGPTIPQCVCLFVCLSGYLYLFLLYFSHLFLFSRFGFSKLAAFSPGQMSLSWVVNYASMCLSVSQSTFPFHFHHFICRSLV